jgi:ABC-2 type transport system permease protein
MSKAIVIAIREYLAAVKTKGFLVGLILMPLLMGGGVAMQAFTKGLDDPTPRSIAVLDRTPGEQLWPALRQAADAYNAAGGRGLTAQPRYTVEHVPAPANDAALDAKRLELSNRVRSGALTSIVEIGPDALRPKPTTLPASAPADEVGESAKDAVFYSTNRPALIELRDFVSRALQVPILAARLTQPRETIEAVNKFSRGVLASRGLARKTEAGEVTFESRSNETATLLLPVGMVVVMLMVVLVGASPLATNIIEEKQLRIAEVLVGSVTPFTLMLGKLLGSVATSLTLGAIYLGGAAMAANQAGVLAILSPMMVIWFALFTVVACLMYGAMFIIAGAAATNVKEAQALMTPMMLIVVMPMFLVGPLMNEPHGTIGLAGTIFPLTAPLVTMMRLTTPPPIGLWQPIVALLSSGLMTIALVWIAGRIFRAGFLLVGRPAKMGELLGWIVRG